MLKREDPFTPQVRHGKRVKDYGTPLTKTPLRNMMSVENIQVPDNALVVEPAQQHQQKRRQVLLSRSKKSVDILSPAPGISPRAAPVSVNSPASLGIRHSPSLSALATNAGKQTVEQMTRSFEEWMRIAADNKINAKNTWNFALIDYFSELTFLRDNDNSINFQRASCTLDGCVKIYSSRVDAVADETGRLLSGLNDKNADGHWDIDGGEEGEGEGGEEVVSVKRSKKHSRPPGDTLEKNPENLSLRGKVEMMDGATIDPLFKKTCVDFDDATGGTLLFNLTVDRDLRVIFDSNSARLPNDNVVAADRQFDASLLVQRFGFDLVSLADKSLTSTLDNYSFLRNSSHLLDAVNMHDRLVASLEKLSVEPDPTDFVAEDNPFEPSNPNDAARLIVDSCLDEGNEDNDYGEVDVQYDEGLMEGFSSKPPENNRFAFLEGPGKMKTTWAGAEHWKIKRIGGRNTTSVPKSAAPGQPRTKKLLQVDFTSVDVDLEQLLAKGNISTMAVDPADTTTLPDDLHITSTQFTSLFLKPAWRFSRAVVSRNVQRNADQVQFVEQPIKAELGFEHANQHDDHDNYGDLDGDGDDGNVPDNAPPTCNELLQADPQGPSLAINHNRRAKRIDVLHLKRCIWKSICQRETLMSGVVKALPQQYSQSAERSDLSVQYAFICLLHLANENNLAIEQRPDGDLSISAAHQPN